MRRNFISSSLRFTATLILSCITSFAASSVVTSLFSPKQSDIERAAYYKINVKGAELRDPIRIPNIPGLEFISEGKQRYFSAINGNMTSHTTFVYRVLANEPGEYTVPAFDIQLTDGNAEVPPASITFVRGEPSASGQNKPLGLELNLPKEDFYVGETVPFQIRLFVEAGVRASLISNEPVQESDAFIIEQANDSPQRAVSQRNEAQYQEIVWNYTLTPIKAGAFPLTFHYPIEAVISTEEDAHGFNPNPLGSIFLNSMFNARRVTLDTGTKTITTQSLPRDGRPEDFTGAVGEFAVYQRLSTSTVELGEPVTLTLSISGKGNFDRIQAPQIETKGQWKVYEPKRSFTPTDALGYKGIEKIEYVLIPQTQSIQATPRIEFSYFDPKDGVYRSAVADPVPITITTPESAPQTESIASTPSTQPTAGQLKEHIESLPSPEEGLISIETEMEGGQHSLRPVFFRPSFWVIQVTILAAIILWYVLRIRSIKLREDSIYAHKVFARKAVKKHLLLAENATKNQDALAFFTEAQRCIQSALSKEIGKKANALTWREIEPFLRNKSTAETSIQEARAFFEGTEALRFGGQSINTTDLESWHTRLRTLLETL